MDTTFSKLKVGSKIIFGKHTTVVQEAYRPYYISPPVEEDVTWIKCGGSDNLLISSKVLDVLCLDAGENRRTPENSRYPNLNIHQYLNADGEDWFIPAYDGDTAPSYKTSPGFLSGFSPEEIEALSPMPVPGCLDGETYSCFVRLPLAAEVFELNGSGPLPYFKRYKRRAEAAPYIRSVWNNNYYCPYAFADQQAVDRVSIIRQDGSLYPYGWLSNKVGIRPVISIRSDARFEQCEDGVYHFVPYADRMDVANEDDLLALLGI
jgi:hypothetical protein